MHAPKNEVIAYGCSHLAIYLRFVSNSTYATNAFNRIPRKANHYRRYNSNIVVEKIISSDRRRDEHRSSSRLTVDNT